MRSVVPFVLPQGSLRRLHSDLCLRHAGVVAAPAVEVLHG